MTSTGYTQSYIFHYMSDICISYIVYWYPGWHEALRLSYSSHWDLGLVYSYLSYGMFYIWYPLILINTVTSPQWSTYCLTENCRISMFTLLFLAHPERYLSYYHDMITCHYSIVHKCILSFDVIHSQTKMRIITLCGGYLQFLQVISMTSLIIIIPVFNMVYF